MKNISIPPYIFYPLLIIAAVAVLIMNVLMYVPTVDHH